MTWPRPMYTRSLLVSAMLALGLTTTGYCDDAPVFDLYIEQSPAKAGKITPGSGTHRFSANSLVTLSAEPQPGYQFAYWLGDVTDPAAKQTTVHVNSPKVIVAVFKSADQDPIEKRVGGGGGGDMLAVAMVDLGSPDWSIAGGGGESRTVYVPPVHTPEPTTLALLALGAVVVRRRRR